MCVAIDPFSLNILVKGSLTSKQELAVLDFGRPRNSIIVDPDLNAVVERFAARNLLRDLGTGRISQSAFQYSDRTPSHLRASYSSAESPYRFIAPLSETPSDLFEDVITVQGWRRLRMVHDPNVIMTYVAGACIDEGVVASRRAGWALKYSTVDETQSEPLEGTVGGIEQTLNRAELRGVIAYLQMRVWEACGANTMVIVTDSEYVVEGAASD